MFCVCFVFSLLEPSWAILDVPTTRETPRPGQWGGVRGGVNPSPKGKKEVGRGSSLDHRRPEVKTDLWTYGSILRDVQIGNTKTERIFRPLYFDSFCLCVNNESHATTAAPSIIRICKQKTLWTNIFPSMTTHPPCQQTSVFGHPHLPIFFVNII